MDYLTALAVILGCALASGLGSYLLGQRIEVQARRSCHEVGIAVFLQVGVIFAVLLAFVFNEVWTQFNEAEQAVETECADMMGIAHRAAYMPRGVGATVTHDVIDYLTLVRNDEWPRMRERRSSFQTGRSLSTLFTDIASLDPSTPLLTAGRDRMLSLVGDAYSQRQVRLFQLKSNVPPFLWVLLMSSAVTLTVFVVLSGIEHSLVHAAITGVFAAFLVSILVTIHMLDYPFEGSISISSKTITDSIGEVRHEAAAIGTAPEPAPTATVR